MTTDVVIAGGGPNGLLMACELALADLRPVLLERLPQRATEPKANGLVGRVVQALDYRGLAERFAGRAGRPVPAPRFQFGALPLDLSSLDNNALYALPIPQRRMEELLEQRARELGAEIRRGHELMALNQEADLVTATTSEPPADAVLIRPDGYVAWAAGSGTPGSADGLRHALRAWFGDPV
jgi:2-polyprenyl-6-methoxyphenol hydroxylase-like FAD-dependent oxidoreductase